METLSKLSITDRANFDNWKKSHMSVFEELKKKFYCAATDEEIEEVMTYFFLFGANDWDNLMHGDDLK